MKKMLQDKNAIISELREKLETLQLEEKFES